MRPLGWKRVLVLAPHTDDEISCSGTIARAVAEGANVKVVAFSDTGSEQLAAEFGLSCDVLGVQRLRWLHSYDVRRFGERRQSILEAMVLDQRSFKPDVVLCPSSADGHQDHQVINQEARRAFRNVPLLLGYESPCNQREAKTDVFVELAGLNLLSKVKAMRCYESQDERKHWGDLWEPLAYTRGRQCRTQYAEAFELLGAVL